MIGKISGSLDLEVDVIEIEIENDFNLKVFLREKMSSSNIQKLRQLIIAEPSLSRKELREVVECMIDELACSILIDHNSCKEDLYDLFLETMNDTCEFQRMTKDKDNAFLQRCSKSATKYVNGVRCCTMHYNKFSKIQDKLKQSSNKEDNLYQ
jgi:hypothetical protein